MEASIAGVQRAKGESVGDEVRSGEDCVAKAYGPLSFSFFHLNDTDSH